MPGYPMPWLGTITITGCGRCGNKMQLRAVGETLCRVAAKPTSLCSLSQASVWITSLIPSANRSPRSAFATAAVALGSVRSIVGSSSPPSSLFFSFARPFHCWTYKDVNVSCHNQVVRSFSSSSSTASSAAMAHQQTQPSTTIAAAQSSRSRLASSSTLLPSSKQLPKAGAAPSPSSRGSAVGIDSASSGLQSSPLLSSNLQKESGDVCHGCGSVFQTEFPDRLGYVEKSVLDRFARAIEYAKHNRSTLNSSGTAESMEKMDRIAEERMQIERDKRRFSSRNEDEKPQRRLTHGQKQELEYKRENPGKEVERVKNVFQRKDGTEKVEEFVLLDQSEVSDDNAEDSKSNSKPIDVEAVSTPPSASASASSSSSSTDASASSETSIENGVDSSSLPNSKSSNADVKKEEEIPMETLIEQVNSGEVSEFAILARLEKMGKFKLMTKRDLKELKKMDRFHKHYRISKSGEELAEEHDKTKTNEIDVNSLTQQVHCARCHQLLHYGYSKGNLHTIRAEDFRSFLRSRFTRRDSPPSVLIWMVDIADFDGSIINDMHTLVGAHNPIILAINKMDLLPHHLNESQLKYWLKSECQRRRIEYAHMILISAKKGDGIKDLIQTAIHLAGKNRRTGLRDIYVVGTTNVGKSTLINQLITRGFIRGGSLFDPVNVHPEKGVAMPDANPNPNSKLPNSDDKTDSNDNEEKKDDEMYLPVSSTASVLPGTTLGMVKFHLMPRTTNLHLYDTPGIMQHAHFSNQLTLDELKVTMPRTTRITPHTFRLSAGQTILLGGLVRIDQTAGSPFLFTFFLHNEVTVHITSIKRLEGADDPAVRKPLPTANRSWRSFIQNDNQRKDSKDFPPSAEGENVEMLNEDEDNEASTSNQSEQVTYLPVELSEEQRKANYRKYCESHAGNLLSPPMTIERVQALGLVDGVRVRFNCDGRGWDEACDDIVFPGLGWMAVTGSGPVTLRIQCGGGVVPHRRQPIIPFLARRTGRKWTGRHRILG